MLARRHESTENWFPVFIRPGMYAGAVGRGAMGERVHSEFAAVRRSTRRSSQSIDLPSLRERPCHRVQSGRVGLSSLGNFKL